MADEPSRTRLDPLSWAARNPVFANLALALLLIGGFLYMLEVQQTVFPDMEPNWVIVNVPYPGAAPEEVENGVVLAIEEAIQGVDGVDRIHSTAAENMGTVMAELYRDADRDRVRTDIEAEVARIMTFPEDAESPVIQVPNPNVQALSLIVAAPVSTLALHELAEQLRDQMLQDERISLVEVSGILAPELSIEISQEALRRYNLTLAEIIRRVDQNTMDLPAGEIRDDSGDILLRLVEQRDHVEEFAAIPVISLADGTELTLGSFATIREDIRSEQMQAWLDGTPAVKLDVFRVGRQTPMEVSAAVHEFMDTQRAQLPAEVRLLIWDDSAQIYADRIGLLVRNGLIGLGMVLVILGLFLRPQLAFWVTAGLVAAFMGAFLFMPLLDVSLNMISLFAFILVLGIVVDDAIVVGEATYTHRSRGVAPLDAAIAGVHEMAGPVTFAVLTTIIAFSPMLFVPGVAGDFFRNVPLIVIPILLLSLFESFFVLPAHLAHARAHRENRFDLLQQRFADWLEHFIHHRYAPLARKAIELRYLSLALGLATLIIAAAMVAGGRINFVFMPEIEGDVVTASIEFPFGSPVSHTRQAIEQLVSAAQAADEELGNISEGIYAQLGAAGMTELLDTGNSKAGAHLAFVQVSLMEAGARDVSSRTFTEVWRRQAGELPGARRLRFSADVGPPTGDAVALEISHQDIELLEQVAQELADAMRRLPGVYDIDDGVQPGKQQQDFRLTAAGHAAGLTPEALGSQLRAAFFGVEAARQQRGRHELRILARRAEAERNTEYSLETMLLQLPGGGEIPLHEAADIDHSRSPNSIQRTDGRRTLTVSSDVDASVTSSGDVISTLAEQVLRPLMADYPGLSFQLAGEQQEQEDALAALGRGMLLAMMGTYALMAVAFRSYISPLLVMFAIPFGLVGAVIGHLLMGYNLSLISLFGLVALAGVVINDALVYLITVNKLREKGMDAYEAILAGGTRRFRPILLTSLTTFFGLAPMIFETSLQARFLIPMAVSLGFGVLFVTVIVLLLIPACCAIVEDGKRQVARFREKLPVTG